jgi:hypothetical protein
MKPVYPHGYHGTDKLGRPIYIELISKIKIDDVFKITNEDRLIKYYVKSYERLLKTMFPACSKVRGEIVEQCCTIIDVEGVGIGAVTGRIRKLMNLAFKVGQDNYPEILGNLYLVNAGFLFSALMALVRTFFEEKTRKKMLVEKNTKKLLEIVDSENLPSVLGGTCKCEHIEGGCLYSDKGPWN